MVKRKSNIMFFLYIFVQARNLFYTYSILIYTLKLIHIFVHIFNEKLDRLHFLFQQRINKP